MLFCGGEGVSRQTSAWLMLHHGKTARHWLRDLLFASSRLHHAPVSKHSKNKQKTIIGLQRIVGHEAVVTLEPDPRHKTRQQQLQKKCLSLLESNSSQSEAALCCAALAQSGTDAMEPLIPRPVPGHQRLDARQSPLSASQHAQKTIYIFFKKKPPYIFSNTINIFKNLPTFFAESQVCRQCKGKEMELLKEVCGLNGRSRAVTNAVDQSLPCHEPATRLCLSDLQDCGSCWAFRHIGHCHRQLVVNSPSTAAVRVFSVSMISSNFLGPPPFDALRHHLPYRKCLLCFISGFELILVLGHFQ